MSSPALRNTLALVLAVALAAGIGCNLASSDAATADPPSDGAEASGSGGAGQETSEVPVDVVTVAPSALEETVWTTGELRADEAVWLRAEEDGRIVALHFREGQRVSAGELLVKINDEDLQASLRRAQVQKQLAELRLRRVKALLDDETISQEVYDEAEGELDMVRAEIELIEARIRKTEIHAPFAGVIGLREVSDGSYVTSSNTIATLQSLDPIKIDFTVPEKYAAAVGPGDQVELTVAGVASTFTGEVYAREPRIDGETRTVRLRARAPNSQGRLLPGAFAKVRLVLGRAERALMVPSMALVPGLQQTTVWVVEDGAATPRAVTTGQRTEDRVEIVDGLAVGDRVIVSGVQMVRPGQPVRVTEVTPSAAAADGGVAP